ncbi:hypothetical protein RJ640_001368 [Escallonia rubra]|uniref:VQ domain-containing protein n=1 Tax=Escallonia rubra TaxID=112253 RepID=A0AA88U7F4_9ASTE|nr:hypothetical protein RJ640_001368 [Escallonia rubra]
MDKLLSVHQNKATKQAKPKKKPVKVVYISNPMRVKTSASEFRALVQELTGQDADLPDPSKYPEILDSHQVDPRAMKLTDELKVAGVEPVNELPNRPDLPFEHYDDVFMPQILENFQGLYPASSSLWLDAVWHKLWGSGAIIMVDVGVMSWSNLVFLVVLRSGDGDVEIKLTGGDQCAVSSPSGTGGCNDGVGV